LPLVRTVIRWPKTPFKVGPTLGDPSML